MKGGRGDRHPPYQGGQGGSAPPLSRDIPPPTGTPLIKGDPPAYRHPPYQGGYPLVGSFLTKREET
ncbi:hypothetical protein B1L04_22425 [Microcystis aeruginosa KW]|uniref:Uncharacterized protein n=1 Tax=Microcystis aeruginosa KW TaxID=1960155 RepID=A0A1V4BQ61_MICAE|nr:hypothetical protein B1L04_22425 [Microcystis aeruginosa KW]